MAQLVGLIVSEDEAFKKHMGRLLRAGAIPVSVMDDRAKSDATPPDVVIVDARGDATSAMSSIERIRGANAGASVFAVAMVVVPAPPFDPKKTSVVAGGRAPCAVSRRAAVRRMAPWNVSSAGGQVKNSLAPARID